MLSRLSLLGDLDLPLSIVTSEVNKYCKTNFTDGILLCCQALAAGQVEISENGDNVSRAEGDREARLLIGQGL